MPTHEGRQDWLDRNVEPRFHDLIWANFKPAMSAALMKVKSRGVRRQLLESVPEGRMRDDVEGLTRMLWRRRHG